jgi:hypothetical protein
VQPEHIHSERAHPTHVGGQARAGVHEISGEPYEPDDAEEVRYNEE